MCFCSITSFIHPFPSCFQLFSSTYSDFLHLLHFSVVSSLLKLVIASANLNGFGNVKNILIHSLEFDFYWTKVWEIKGEHYE